MIYILQGLISGKSHDSTSFPVSAEPKSCTQATQVGVYNFLGNEGNEFMMIDTMGFDDPTKNHDADIIAGKQSLCFYDKSLKFFNEPYQINYIQHNGWFKNSANVFLMKTNRLKTKNAISVSFY